MTARLVASRRTRAALLALSLTCGLVPAAGADVAQDNRIPLAEFPREPLVVETHSARRHTFDAWRADTPEAREQGLMFVREMRETQAMIFVYDPPHYVAMWMKNTLIPLDMLFVNDDGCVIMVKRDAQPQSLATIAADGPTALVVELKGGVATALGIGLGDRVRRPRAGWPTSDRPCPRNP